MKRKMNSEEMEERNMALEAGTIHAVNGHGRRIIETVGAGRCVVPIEKVHFGNERFRYRLQLLRTRSQQGNELGRIFTARDVLDLPKLVQVLAATLVSDGCLPSGLKDDLDCLAATLDTIFTPRGELRTREKVVVPRICLEHVVDYLGKDEKLHFETEDEEAGRVFLALEALRRAIGNRKS